MKAQALDAAIVLGMYLIYRYLGAESYEQRLARHERQVKLDQAWRLDYGKRYEGPGRCC